MRPYYLERRVKMEVKSSELSDIVDPSYLQAMHDIFSEETGLASAILDLEGRPITFECNHCSFCTEVRKTKAGVELCKYSDQDIRELAKKEFKRIGKPIPVFHVCRLGIVDFCAPIVASGEIIAFFFSGQFRCSWGEYTTLLHPSLDNLRKVAAKTGDNPDFEALEREFKKVREVNEKKFKSVKRSLERLARQLNSFVARLDKWRRVKVVEDFMQDAVGVGTVKDLFTLMIERLPDMMDARECSILTIQQDEKGYERLVLRKTSFKKLKSEENSAYYDKGWGLTGWVWKHARSLRLINLQDPAELAAYADLEWKHKYDDSDEHTSFLCVPMLGHAGQVIGVIRVPHKERGVPFSKRDEIFLNFLGRYVSWVMEYQTVEDKLERTAGLFKVARKLASGLSYRQVLDAAIESSVALFGEENKKHFLVTLEADGKDWKIDDIKGELALKQNFKITWKSKHFSVENGFTGWVIANRDSYFSSDIEELEARGSNYLAPVERGKSAIAAPLCWGSEVYGAISIISNKKFDFSREKERELFTLTKLIGAAIRSAKPRDSGESRGWIREIISKTCEILRLLVRLIRPK